MRILLVNTNFEPPPDSAIKKPIPTVGPIGLAYLSFPLKRKGYRIEMFDLSKAKDPEIAFKSTLNKPIDNWNHGLDACRYCCLMELRRPFVSLAQMQSLGGSVYD